MFPFVAPSLTLAVVLTAAGACGPAIVLDDGTSGSTTSSNPTATATGPSVPPNNTPTTPNPPTSATSSPPGTTAAPTTTSPPGECVPGDTQSCVCPNGQSSEQICSGAGVYEACPCEAGSTSGRSGSSSGWGSSESSGGGGPDQHIPDLPPGESCLSVDTPCLGQLEAESDAELEAYAACARIEGDLIMGSAVSSLEPLGCLREVEGLIFLTETEVEDFSGLEGLEFTEILVILANSELTEISLPSLGLVHRLFVFEQPQLTQVNFPSLSQIVEILEVFGNPMLPNCEVAELVEQTSPPELGCENNLADMCTGICD